MTYRNWTAFLIAGVVTCSITASGWACNTSSGEITRIDPKSSTVLVSTTKCCGSADEVKFQLTGSTKVQINGKPASLADLKQGDKVKVDYEKTDEVLSVTVTRES